MVPIRVPLLSERREDIPLLAETFFDELCALHQKSLKHLTSDALDLVLEYAWPGNVRELKNVVERIVVTCRELEVEPAHLPSRIRHSGDLPKEFLVPLGSSIEEVERALIEGTLSEVTSNRKGAAAMLGISVRTLQYKIKKYGLT